MKKKIFLYYIILIVIGVSVTGFFTSELTQRFYKNEVEEKLKNSANLIKYNISEQIAAGNKVDYNKIAVNYAKLLDASSSYTNSSQIKSSTRITFIDYSGNVLGESDTDYREMENHSNRKEVQEAIQGKTGSDVRFSKTLKMNFLYIAVPFDTPKVVIRISVPLIQLKNIDRAIWYYTLIGILAGVILTTLLALKFSSSVTKPINELIAATKEISMGNYSKRVNINAKDEFSQFAVSFNRMAAKLEEVIAEMTDKNLKVDSIINSMISGIAAVDTNYKVMLINSIACEMFGIKNGPGVIGINIIELIRNHQINHFLKETIEKNTPLSNEIIVSGPEEKILRVYTSPIKSLDSRSLNSGGIAVINDITNVKKLEQIRTEFVSNVTHELKTPLTSIRGFIETLRGGAIEDREVADKFLEIIDIEAERLYMLINDILQLSEIETKQKDSNISTHNFKSIAEEVLLILKDSADKKGIKLIGEIEDNIKIVANRDRIKQMLINLIDNGIKYNRENGSVTLKAYKYEGKIIITVKDTGIGIAKEHLARIFERFYRVDKGRSRSMGGTGLGLSIVKHIVNLYSGDIKVNSTTGSGTEFTIQLPA